MRFSTKLIIVFETVFILLTVVIGFSIGGMAYDKTRESTIDSYIFEADSIMNNIQLYLNDSLNEHKHIEDYASDIVDGFSKDSVNIEVFDKEKKHLAGIYFVEGLKQRSELTAAMNNLGEQSIVLRHNDDGKYLAFFSQYIEHGKEGLLIVAIKDISFLDQQKKSIFEYVIRNILIGMILVAIIIMVLAHFLLKPVKRLNTAAYKIAIGDYHERVVVESEDEFGLLATSFNIMADAVENNIAELSEQNMIQRRVMDNLTHELRTPLTSIIGYSELLQKIEYSPETYQKALNYINSEGKRMLALNKMLLSLTRVEQAEFVFEKIDLATIIQEICELSQLRAEKCGVKLVYQPVSCICEGIPNLIKSIITNLVDNALKATDKGDVITVVSACNQKNCFITVRDTGKGMNAEKLKYIKEPFYQIESSRYRSDEISSGVGLGLSIVDEIIKRHDGTIKFYSKIGVGTTVVVSLPKEHSE